MNGAPDRHSPWSKLSGVRKIGRFVRLQWDEIGIATALGHFVASGGYGPNLDPEHAYIVEAIRRSRTDLRDADIEEIRQYVASLDDYQIPGFVNNIKGIAHEIYFVEAENEDGDTVYAYLFEDTNHPDYDVVLLDTSTGETMPLQLKATDNASYVREAVREVGADRVVVTEELADRLGLESSGIENEELEADVHELVDQLLEDRSLWDYVPGLSAWSLAMVLAELARRYARREITRQQLVTMVGVIGGAKLIKVVLIVAALSTPGLNLVAGAWLIARAIQAVREVYEE